MRRGKAALMRLPLHFFLVGQDCSIMTRADVLVGITAAGSRPVTGKIPRQCGASCSLLCPVGRQRFRMATVVPLMNNHGYCYQRANDAEKDLPLW